VNDRFLEAFEGSVDQVSCREKSGILIWKTANLISGMEQRRWAQKHYHLQDARRLTKGVFETEIAREK
jgi:hypothetical protein